MFLQNNETITKQFALLISMVRKNCVDYSKEHYKFQSPREDLLGFIKKEDISTKKEKDFYKF